VAGLADAAVADANANPTNARIDDLDATATGGRAPFRERLVLPGDDVTPAIEEALAAGHGGGGAGGAGEDVAVRLGAGLSSSPGAGGAAARVRATRGGVLCCAPGGRFFVLSSSRRYASPGVGDVVVGVVASRTPEGYGVRLGGAAPAFLPALAFDGATKRNKPELRAGAAVFARVVRVAPHCEPELSCAAPGGPGGPRAKDWMTGEALYGELKGGALVAVSSLAARRLLDPRAAVLTALGGALPFEAAVGVNGLVWVQAATPAATAAVARALADADGLDDAAAAGVGRAAAARAAQDAAGD